MGDLTFSVTVSGAAIAEALGVAPAQFFDSLKAILATHTTGAATENDAALLTQKEAAALLQVSKGTLINWAREGIVRPIKRGRRTYYNKAELLKATSNNH